MFLLANFNIQIIRRIHVYMQCLDILVFLSWPSAVPNLVWSGWQPRWPAIDWPVSGSSVRWTYGWSPISWATTMPGCAAPQPASLRPLSPVHTSGTPSDKPETSSALIKKWRWVNFFSSCSGEYTFMYGVKQCCLSFWQKSYILPLCLRIFVDLFDFRCPLKPLSSFTR